MPPEQERSTASLLQLQVTMTGVGGKKKRKGGRRDKKRKENHPGDSYSLPASLTLSLTKRGERCAKL